MTASTTAELGRVIDAQTLRMERVLKAPIDKVWSFLVDPAKRARWLAGGTAPANPGECIDLRFDNDKLTDEKAPPKLQQYAGKHEFQCRILKIEPPRLLVMTFQEGSPNASEVSFELSARGDHTHLTLVHSKLKQRSSMLNVAGGWHSHLDVLEDVLAGRTPRSFWTNFGARQEAYDRIIPAA
ncbi:MAG TPA: SRPBCC family protein [Burkholderiaceae bacterium]|nr:SRPBCC family protein [Burkholderiaceae bacterium]